MNVKQDRDVLQAPNGRCTQCRCWSDIHGHDPSCLYNYDYRRCSKCGREIAVEGHAEECEFKEQGHEQGS